MECATFEQFKKDLSCGGPWMLFVGAAVSRAEPTSLPMADELKGLLISRLARPLSEPRPEEQWTSSALALLDRYSHTLLPSRRFHGQVSNMPLDALFAIMHEASGHSDNDITRRLIMPVYGSPRLIPNWNHLAIANLCIQAQPIIRLVVTTNFDCLIERAFEAKHYPVRVLYWDNDFDEHNLERLANNSVPTLVKLHGSAHEGAEGSIMASMQEMKNGLAAEKREYLQWCLTQFNCIFVGYKGADWDVAPVIADSLNISARRHRTVTYRLSPRQEVIPDWWYDTNIKSLDADLRFKDENVFRHMLELKGLPTERFRGEFNQQPNNWEASTAHT